MRREKLVNQTTGNGRRGEDIVTSANRAGRLKQNNQCTIDKHNSTIVEYMRTNYS